jgi:hypothetical protein
MQRTDHSPHSQSTVRAYNTSLFVALERSRSIWLAAISAPGSDKVSKYRVAAGDTSALLSLLVRLKARARQHCKSVQIVSIYEAGLDGFGYTACQSAGALTLAGRRLN